MTQQIKKDLPSKETRIRNLAYLLWMEDGCPEGRDQAHWLEAEDLLDAQEADPKWLVREVKVLEPAKAEAKVEDTFVKRQNQKAA